jgi:hypothetical protein
MEEIGFTVYSICYYELKRKSRNLSKDSVYAEEMEVAAFLIFILSCHPIMADRMFQQYSALRDVQRKKSTASSSLCSTVNLSSGLKGH